MKFCKIQKMIIFAPGNPITSIGSIISIKSFNKLIKSLKKKVLIISPFISNKSISGPSEIYMKAKKIEPTIEGLINFYSEFTNNMIFSKKDKKEIKEKIGINYPDVNFHFTDILMNTTIKRRKFCKIYNFKFSQLLNRDFC